MPNLLENYFLTCKEVSERERVNNPLQVLISINSKRHFYGVFYLS